MKIKNWKKFQHFKDRRPPWIKLYRDILEDPDWHKLKGDDAKALVMLWLIASEDKDMEGTLPGIEKLTFRLRMTEKAVYQQLKRLVSWIDNGDIIPISTRCQSDTPEKRREREEKEKTHHKPSRFQKPTPQAVQAYAQSIGFELSGQKFCNSYESKGWLVGRTPMKDWKAAVRTWKSNGYESNNSEQSLNDKLLEERRQCLASKKK